MTRFLNISTDNTLGSSSPSNELVSSQKAVKDYVDGKVPTVNNPTITITQGGVTKGSFTLNQASGDTIALDAGGGGAVDSVNGKTGVVVLTATDVGALPDSTVIPDAQIQSDWNQADNTKVDYIKNKPTIPTVGNGTITITQGGVSKGTFTTNQSGNTTIALDSGGGSVAVDNITINKNLSDEIQTVAMVDQNSGSDKIWTGDSDGYEAIVGPDSDTFYAVTDDIGAPATVIAELAEGLNNKVDIGHQVIAFQEPTAANNYTWYRKYDDGWVEQGGCYSQNIGTGDTAWSATLPVPMLEVGNYTASVNTNGGYAGNTTIQCEGNTSTVVKGYGRSPSGAGSKKIMWRVEGMAA